MRARSRGASLVEVLVALGVVLALGLVAVRTLGTASQDQGAREASCVETLTCAPSSAGQVAPAPSVDLKDVLPVTDATPDEKTLPAALGQVSLDQLLARLDRDAIEAERLMGDARRVIRDRMTTNGGEQAREIRVRALALVQDYADTVEELRRRGVPVDQLQDAYHLLDTLQNDAWFLGSAIQSTPGMNGGWSSRFLSGFVLGNFADDETLAATIGQGAGSLIPWVWMGVAARDVTHAGIRLFDSGGREGWVELGVTVASTPPGARFLVGTARFAFRGVGRTLDAVNRWAGIGAAAEVDRILARDAKEATARALPLAPKPRGSYAAPIVRRLAPGDRVSIEDVITRANARTVDDDLGYIARTGGAPNEDPMKAALRFGADRKAWTEQLESLGDAFLKHPGSAEDSIFIDMSGRTEGPTRITPPGYVEMRLHGPANDAPVAAFQDNLSARHVADTIRNAGGANRPVLLYSCNGGTAIGSCPILAQELADELGQPVIAADREITPTLDTTAGLLGAEPDLVLPVSLKNKIPDFGRWRVFLPTAKSN